MLALDNNQKFESVKYRHEDQAKLLQMMTEIDLKVFMSFLTLQLALGGFLSQFSVTTEGKLGLLFIDISLSLICSILLWNNYKRRKEVVGTLKNCNKALGYDVDGIYIKDGKINSATKFRPWFWWYIIGVIISLIGIVIILTTSPISNELKTKANTEQSQ